MKQISVYEFAGVDLSEAQASGEPARHQLDEGGNHERSGEWRNRLGYTSTGYDSAGAKVEGLVGWETGESTQAYVMLLSGSYVLAEAS